MQSREGLIDRLKVPAYRVGAHLAVGFLDRFLDLGDRLFARQYARDRKVAGLHDRVDAAAHAGFFSHSVSVDGEEADAFLDHLLLQLARQALPHAVRRSRNIQQKHRTGSGVLEHVDLVDEVELMAGDKLGVVMRYAERIGRGLARRCEIVIAPDFFES